MNLDLPDLPGAVCISIGTPDAWHPDRPSDSSAEAIAICRGCPEREPCLSYAVANPVAGIWGGTTVLEREQMRRDGKIRVAYGPTRRSIMPAPNAAAATKRQQRRLQAAGVSPAYTRRRDHNTAEAQRLHGTGVSPTTIAGVLGVSLRSVERYLADRKDAA